VTLRVRVSEEEEEARVRVFALIPYQSLRGKNLRELTSLLSILLF